MVQSQLRAKCDFLHKLLHFARIIYVGSRKPIRKINGGNKNENHKQNLKQSHAGCNRCGSKSSNVER